MAYTRITNIVAPSSAEAGERVSVTIQIQNLWSGSVLVAAVGVCEGKRDG